MALPPCGNGDAYGPIVTDSYKQDETGSVMSFDIWPAPEFTIDHRQLVRMAECAVEQANTVDSCERP